MSGEDDEEFEELFKELEGLAKAERERTDALCSEVSAEVMEAVRQADPEVYRLIEGQTPEV